MGKVFEKKVAYLVSMGFTEEQARNALAITEENRDEALDYLL